MGVRSFILPVCTVSLLILSLTLWTGQFNDKDTTTSDSTTTKQKQYVPRYEEVILLKNNFSTYWNNSISCARTPVKCLLLAAKIIFKYSNVTMAQASLEDNTTGNMITKLMNSSQYIRTAKRLTLLGIYITYEVFKVVMYSSVGSILVATMSIRAIHTISVSKNIQRSSEFRQESTANTGIQQCLKLKIVNTISYLIESALSWLFNLIAMVNKLIYLCCPLIAVVAILMWMGGTVEAGYSGTLQKKSDTQDSREVVDFEEILPSPVNIQNDEHQKNLRTREHLSRENMKAHSLKLPSEKLQGSHLKHYYSNSLFGKICKINDWNSTAQVHTNQSILDTSNHFAVLNQFLSKPQQALYDILEIMISSIPDIPPIDHLISWQISPLLNFYLFLIMACCHLYVIRHSNYYAFNVNGPVASVQEDNASLLPNSSSYISSNYTYQFISHKLYHTYDYLSDESSIEFIQPAQCSNVANDMSKMAQVLPDRKLVRESRVGPLNSEMVVQKALSKPVGAVLFEGQLWQYGQDTNDCISLFSNEEEMLQGTPILFNGQSILGFSSHREY